MPKKLKIAVTGGYGTGKSKACELLLKKGYKVISADPLAKELLANDPEVREKIINAFGQKSYDGTEPDKKFLANLVFNDVEKLEKINNIIHPRTIVVIEKKMNEILKKEDIVFVESALIFEAKREEKFDHILLITADEKVRIKRIIERDKIDEKTIHQRIKNQIPEEEKRKKSDFVIENNGDVAELDKRLDFILMVIKSMV